MHEKFLKPYNPAETEDRIYKLWLERGDFSPQPNSGKEPFSMVLPPPNVTGVLHMGHATMVTIEDIMARYARAQGKDVLWIPGTDHAAIATQAKVESEIYKKEGKTRHDLGREEFLRRVREFAQTSHDTIVSQVKKLGASLDWSREAFTLDEPRSLAVRTAFKKMYDDGLIYRGARLVNWDPKMQTTVSDDEIETKEVTENFYYLKYGPFTIGTARPETKFGDKYVVMHPADERYKKWAHGQKIELEWINGPITATVIKDEAIDMTFGTGVMTITPAHDMTDYDIAARYQLEQEQIIDLKGKLLPIAGEFAGLHIKKARPLIVKKLEEKGLVEKIDEKYTHAVPTNSRGGEIIEPQILKQWFVAVNKPIATRGGKTLKELMRDSVATGQIKITPERFEKIYFHWIDNLRDWCISRQIWYGHQIPVWYRSAISGSDSETYVGTEKPEGEGWEQDPDTLDTWFSSGLWSFSTMTEEERKRYHPLTMMETGYDIIFFWVARMILMSQYLLGEVPFKEVYLHGIVRDEQGKKMSKSLGNTIDPLEMIAKYGADAVRMSLIIGTSPGNDSRISEDKIKAYKHFANKIWNATRFVLIQKDEVGDVSNTEFSETDKQYLVELEQVEKEIHADMANYRFYLAAEKLYHYFWHRYADIIIEEVKKRPDKKSGVKVLEQILAKNLILLSPFMPFITEEIWQLTK